MYRNGLKLILVLAGLLYRDKTSQFIFMFEHKSALSARRLKDFDQIPISIDLCHILFSLSLPSVLTLYLMHCCKRSVLTEICRIRSNARVSNHL